MYSTQAQVQSMIVGAQVLDLCCQGVAVGLIETCPPNDRGRNGLKY